MADVNQSILDSMINNIVQNFGRGSKERIGENTYEVENLTKTMRDDYEWLKGQATQFDPTLRTTQKTSNRYGVN